MDSPSTNNTNTTILLLYLSLRAWTLNPVFFVNFVLAVECLDRGLVACDTV
jgi:hypothetical protein